jgi:hypothetical protein
MSATAETVPRPATQTPWVNPWNRYSAGAALAAMTTAAILLRAQGRVIWCACGVWNPWAGDIHSRHNSQHLFDPYSFTHVLHGFLGFGLTYWLLPRRVPIQARVALVAVFESCWELLENSSFIIEKYRAATISLDYYGDSVINSMSDIFCCVVGFTLASRLPWYWTVALFVVVEAVLLWWIRDSLVVNLVMLIYPIKALKDWQSAG